MFIKTSRFNVIPDRHTAEEIENLQPIFGVQVFDTTNQLLKFWNGNVWENAGSGAAVVGQRVGGNYYPSGWYLWDGSTWTSDRNNIVNQLQLNVNGLGTKSNVGHTHVKANITDFSDADYATEEQGVLASSSIQPDDNVSELTNDAGYINLDDLGIDGLEDYYDELIYAAGLLTTIETYTNSSKTVNLFTKSFTYSGGVLTQITLLNIVENTTETKTLNYDVNGNLINITKS